MRTNRLFASHLAMTALEWRPKEVAAHVIAPNPLSMALNFIQNVQKPDAHARAILACLLHDPRIAEDIGHPMHRTEVKAPCPHAFDLRGYGGEMRFIA